MIYISVTRTGGKASGENKKGRDISSLALLFEN